MIIVHLITQRNQPYGSVRECCERCGGWEVLKDLSHRWTDSPHLFENLPEGHVRCDKQPTKG